MRNLKAKNILHIVLSLKFGGLEKLVVDMTEQLNKGNFTAMICCLEEKGELYEEAVSKNIEVFVLNKKKGLDFSFLPKLIKLLRVRDIAIIHNHNAGAAFYGSVAGFFARTQAILSSMHSREKKTSSNIFWQIIWNLNKKIVFVSNDARVRFLKYFGFRRQDKMEVIYNGIDLDKFKINDIANDCFDGNLKNSKIIGTVSRLSKEKDQKTLIDAVKIVSKNRNDIRFLFVGDGPMRNELEEYSIKNGLKECVTFLGFKKDVAESLKNIDIFVLSSLTEGISVSLLESMAAGKPAIVTNVGGNPEIVVDGETGILVPSKDPQKMAESIMKIIQNPDLAKKMGRAGRKRVEGKFSLQRMVREYEQIYKECLRTDVGA